MGAIETLDFVNFLHFLIISIRNVSGFQFAGLLAINEDLPHAQDSKPLTTFITFAK